MSSNVVRLEPKTIEGRKGDADWRIIYDMKQRKWNWRITVHLAPQVFEGTCDTQSQAGAEVNKRLTAMGYKPVPMPR